MGVTIGWLPQRAGSSSQNGGGEAAMVTPLPLKVFILNLLMVTTDTFKHIALGLAGR